jgi:hypothetical protein
MENWSSSQILLNSEIVKNILFRVDQGIIYDCLSAVIKNRDYKNGITPENAVKMLQLLTLVMKNKHSTYVKGAMQLIN